MATPFVGYAVKEKGSPLELFEYDPAPLGELDIDIQVTHNGLCHTDIHMRDNDWGVSGFPFIPGHEVIGNITQVGHGVKHLSVGDRVGYAWIKDSCGGCGHCVRGYENVCLTGYTGLITAGGHGGWQKTMRAPAKFAFKIPDGLDSISAAPLLCAGVTVYSPIRKYVNRPGVKVGVIGIGGLGHLAIQFAAAVGAEVTAISTSPSKEQEAKDFGATHFVTLDQTEKLTNSFDLIINTVPSKNDYTVQMSFLRVDGTLCIVGLPIDDIRVGVLDVVFNQKKVVGSIVGGSADMQEMLQFAAVKGIKPKCQTMPLSQVNQAIEKLLRNEARYRIVLVSDF